jgi:hypothetical protein
MDILVGLTEEQGKKVLPELQELVKGRHQYWYALLSLDPENDELINQTIAWEYICQNLQVEGYDWS